MVTKSQVLNALTEVYDPEIPIDIVSMGLIYGVTVVKDRVTVKMTLSSPTCPMGSLIGQMVKEKVSSLKGVKEVEIDLVFEPRWTPSMISKEAKKKLGLS